MNDQARDQALDVARALAARGDIDASVRAFLRAGALDEATRVLIGADRFGEAGRLLLRELGVPPAKVGSLDGAGKKRAQKAAVCFSRAGEVDAAVELFLGLGDTPRAVQVLERAGQHLRAARLSPQSRQAQPVVLDPSRPGSRAVGKGEVITKAAAQRLEAAGQLEAAMRAYVKLKLLADAGRMARALGNLVGAGQLFADGGQPYEAARCFHEAGDSGKAVQCLVRVPRDHARYRSACVRAINLAIGLQSLDFELDQFLTRFIHDGPRDENEMEAFYLLGKLYQTHDFLENAREVYSKLAAVSPRYRDVSDKIAAIDAETRGSAMVFGKIVREDAAFRAEQGPAQSGRAKAAYAPTEARLADLPDLPPLPAPAKRPGHAAPVAGEGPPAAPPRRTPPPASRNPTSP